MKLKESKRKKKSVVDSEISKMRAAGEISESFAGFLSACSTHVTKSTDRKRVSKTPQKFRKAIFSRKEERKTSFVCDRNT